MFSSSCEGVGMEQLLLVEQSWFSPGAWVEGGLILQAGWGGTQRSKYTGLGFYRVNFFSLHLFLITFHSSLFLLFYFHFDNRVREGVPACQAPVYFQSTCNRHEKVTVWASYKRNVPEIEQTDNFIRRIRFFNAWHLKKYIHLVTYLFKGGSNILNKFERKP